MRLAVGKPRQERSCAPQNKAISERSGRNAVGLVLNFSVTDPFRDNGTVGLYYRPSLSSGNIAAINDPVNNG